MLTRHAAARLLADATDRRALARLAAAAGFDAEPAPLDAAARAALGLPAPMRRVDVARGAGALRALLVEVPAGTPLRDVVGRAATRLAARTPQLRWLLLAAERHGHAVAVAAWRPGPGAPRVQALLADRRRVVESDADTLAALAAARDGGDLLVHQRWCEVLGRDALTRRFYRELERLVTLLADDVAPRPPRTEARELALLCTSRLLFLCFLQSKGWLDGDRDWLAARFARCMAAGGGYHARVLLPLWFGTLNTPPRRRAPAARALGAIPFLNGGLFARTPLERRFPRACFSDAALGALMDDLLVRYRFTAREDVTAFSEAAVDPEMLGRAFESLMAAGERRTSGAYYTPQPLVEAVTTEALARALAGPGLADEALARRALAGEHVDAGATARLRERATALRVLDPACGSGAFLVHVLERLAALLRHLGDPRAIPALRRALLAGSIFGVDLNPTAVWLCELRLWLSVVMDDEATDARLVPPLPNLDHHVRPGDALAAEAFDAPDAPRVPRAGSQLALLRERYARASGRRKVTIAERLEREERACALARLDARAASLAARRRDLLAAARTPDLFGRRLPPDAATRARLRALREELRETRARRRAIAAGGALPFAFATHFADVGARGGFDVIVGNPPWVRVHHIGAADRTRLRRSFRVFREAGWKAGAEGAGAAPGFAAQVDAAALFTERALQLARPGGTLALLLPAKLWCTLAGGGVRALLAREADVLALEDWSEAPASFDAAVYPSLLVARRRDPPAGAASETPAAPDVAAARHRHAGTLRWRIRPQLLALDADPASPWLAAPAEVRAAFDRLVEAGEPFASSTVSRPLLGVKSGCNAAFVVDLMDAHRADGLALVRAGPRAAPVERALLRVALRGQDVLPWSADAGAARVLWTHDACDAPLATLPPHARDWLAPHRAALAARSDARGRRAWWTLFRTEAARFDLPRVVWADVGRAPRAAVLREGDRTVPFNSCYVARCASEPDALALAALLNGPLAAAWLALIAEPARGGYRRYLGWTMARLPLPRDWARARALLAPLAARAIASEPVSPHQLLEAALEAYALRRADVAALLLWADR